MKNKLITQTKRLLALCCMVLLSLEGYSQHNVTMTLSNQTITSNEIEFDMEIKNDGPGIMDLWGVSFGVNFNTAILNGGTPALNAFSYMSGTYLPQSIMSQFNYNINCTQYSNSQMRFTITPISNAQIFPVGATYKLGRFKFINTVAFASGVSPALSLQLTTQVGKTRCEVAIVPSGSGTISIIPGPLGTLTGVGACVETFSTINQTLCPGQTYTWTCNGYPYNISGTYTCTYLNAAGCTHTETLNLAYFPDLSTSTTVTACDSYTWNCNNATYTASGVYTNTYLDMNGCVATCTLNLTINNSCNTLICFEDQPITCNGDDDASIQAVASPPNTYTYILDGGADQNSTGYFSNLGPGTHTICVNGVCCTTTITEPDPLNVTLVNTACGEITANITGGTNDFPDYLTYWFGPFGQLDPSNYFDIFKTGLSSGNYTVIVEDNHGCIDIATITINTTIPTANAGPDVTVTCTTPSAILTATGGGTYLWSNGPTTASQTVTPTVNTCYTVTVTGANGCTATDIVCVNVDKTPPIANAGPDVTVNCTTPSATLTATGGGTYLWSNGPTTSSQTVTPTVNNCYTVTVTGANGCTATDIVCVNVDKTPPTANAGPDVTVTCTTPSAILTATGGGTYLWSNGPTTSSQTVTPTVNTCYTVTVTGANGCTATDIVCVIVDKTPPIANAGPDVTVTCTTPSSTLTATGGDTYAWSNGPTTASQTVTPTVNTCYTVTVTGANGCTATDIVCVNVDKTPPIANAGPDVTVTCTTPSSTLTATGGDTYAWSNGPTTASQTVTPTVNTCYTVTVTGANGCTATDIVCVNVDKTPPTANAGPDVTVTCTTPSAILAATGGGTYLWSNGPTTSSQTVTPTVNTCYTVTVTGANGCTATDIVCVIVDKTPPIANAGPDVTVTCTTPSSTLTATGGDTYAWSNGPTTASQTVTPTVNTCYTVTVTGANGCTATDIVCVIVDKTPPIANAGPDVTVTCTTPSAILTATGGGTYLWSNGPTTSSQTVTPTVNTCYTVTVTGANGCTATDIVCVIVDKTPPIANAGPDVTVTCTTPSSTLTATGGDTYAWSNGATTASQTVTPTVNTCYTVTVTGANGCTATDIVCVNVDKTPPTANAGPDVTVTCTTPSAILTATGGGTYLWSNGPTTSSQTVTPTVNTCYTVTVTGANGCTATDIVCVIVDKTPPIANAGPDVTVTCTTPSSTLTATGGDTYAWSNGPTTASQTVTPTVNTCYTVTVTGANGCTATDIVCVNVDKTPPTVFASNIFGCVCDPIDLTIGINMVNPVGGSGVFNPTSPYTSCVPINTTYTYTYTAPNGCSTTVTKKLTIKPLPTIIAMANKTTICVGDFVSILPFGGSTYTVMPSGETTTSAPFVKMPLETTTYTVTGKGSTNCTNTTTVTITVVPLPTITATIDLTLPICSGQTVTITPAGATTYTITPYGETTTTSFTKSPMANTTYTITGSNAYGCTATTIVTVTVIQCTGVKISPKVFLSGPYDPTNGKMKDNLRACGAIPLVGPYSSLPYSGMLSGVIPYFIQALELNPATTNPVLYPANPSEDNAIVDWVFLELRSDNAPNYTVFSTRMALLQRDGDVVDIDGTSPVFFPLTPLGNYYVSIKHRNHTGVMTASALPLSATPTTVDFTSGTVWVSPSALILNAPRRVQSSPNGNVFTLWAGNAYLDDKVRFTGVTNDPEAVLAAVGGPGCITCQVGPSVYRIEDVNMDCIVKYLGLNMDRAIIQQNVNVSTKPTIFAHIPQ